MTAVVTLLIFAVAIVVMVVAIARFKVHPFLAMLGVSLILALVLGVPLAEIPDVLSKGFGGVFGGIGLVIILGTLIGSVLERTGGAVAMARGIERVVGRRHPRLAMMLIGWVVSIPVFCDSGFVLVSPIGRSLARRTGHSPVALALALAAGLFASHVFIPPTPGPVAAAGMMGLNDHLLLVIALGVVFSLLCLVPVYWLIGRVARHLQPVEAESAATDDSHTPDARVGAVWAFLPIVAPVLLMALGSVAPWLQCSEAANNLLVFLGKPAIALMVALLCCLPLLVRQHLLHKIADITQSSLMTAGPVIFITAAGGVLGSVMVATGFVEVVKQWSGSLAVLGVVFPFLVAAILKTAQGSSTVAITTTASMMGMFSDAGSMMSALNFTTPLSAALVVMAIGAGAMTVAHANDSYFWVVMGFGGIHPRDGYRSFTLVTLVMGLTAITLIAIAAALLL